jgi:hypothetical protein
MRSLKWSFLMLLVGGWLRRQRATCGRSRLAALLLGRATCGRSRLMALRWRLLGVLLCPEARSIGRAVQWSPMEPEGWSGRFPLKSSPACSYRCWLRLTERAVRTRELHCWNVRANRSWTSSWLIRLPPILLLVPWDEPNIETACNNSCAITIVGYPVNELFPRYRFG